MLRNRTIAAFAVTAVALSMGWASGASAAPIIFQGIDVGATSLATGPNSQAASIAFDLATGPLNIIDFDTNNSGATLSPASSPQACGFALCGGNTTPGGSNWYGHVFTTTITFDSPINAFGAYFSGWQRAIQTLTYTDGTTEILDMPAGDINSGGLVFFGFTDVGKSISSIVYDTVSGDFVAIDDMRFGMIGGSVPESSTLALFAAALMGLALAGRRRRSQ